jgi:hypothetical protein
VIGVRDSNLPALWSIGAALSGGSAMNREQEQAHKPESLLARLLPAAIMIVMFHVDAADAQRGGGVAGCPVPANDSCDSPEHIFSGSTSFNPAPYCIAAADIDPREPLDDCAAEISHSVWYEFIPCAVGSISINTNGSDYDTVLAVFSGDCDSLTMLICDDDGGTSGASQITNFAIQPLTRYLIRVARVGPPSLVGTLDFNFAFAPFLFPSPPNDTCTMGTVINPSGAVFDPPLTCTSGADASPAEPQESCEKDGAGVSNTVWYFLTPCTDGTISLDTFGSEYDTVIAVFTGSCLVWTEVACDDDEPPSAHSLIEGLPVTGGTLYRIKVSDWDTQGGGGLLDFNVNFKGACRADVSPPGEGDCEVDASDLGELLANWGPCSGKGACPTDLFPAEGGDGVVGAGDLAELLAGWGSCS